MEFSHTYEVFSIARTNFSLSILDCLFSVSSMARALHPSQIDFVLLCSLHLSLYRGAVELGGPPGRYPFEVFEARLLDSLNLGLHPRATVGKLPPRAWRVKII